MASTRRVRVAKAADVPPGQGRVVDAEGRTLALFNVDGAFFAIDNACAHRGGPLGDGEIEGTTVTCPWHAWRWDVTTGANVNNPGVKVSCFVATVDGGEVYVTL